MKVVETDREKGSLLTDQRAKKKKDRERKKERKSRTQRENIGPGH